MAAESGRSASAVGEAVRPTVVSKLAAWPSFSSEEIAAVAAILSSGKVNYWTGHEGRSFESEFAAHCRSEHAIALANGSVALELALEAAGIGPGDDVVVTPRSFIASASCAIRVGARPVFADVCPESQNITAESVERVLTPHTAAVVAVHHAGWPCDMDALMELAEKHGLLIIEDCAQAHGATYKGRPVGGLGHIAAFSFCQDKIMTTAGEGGMLVTNDRRVWNRAWPIKDHGKSYTAVFEQKHPPGYRWLHDSFGTNWRMTEMQAAIGRIQLRKLHAWHRRRKANAKRIAETIRGYPAMRVPEPGSGFGHAYYRLYAFVVEERLKPGWSRDRIIEELNSLGIPGLTGSCPEIYREKAFDDLSCRPKAPLPVAAALGPASVAFLVHPTLTEDDLNRTCDALDSVLSRASIAAG